MNAPHAPHVDFGERSADEQRALSHDPFIVSHVEPIPRTPDMRASARPPQREISVLKPLHKAVADAWIVEPKLTKKQLAERFNVTVASISIVTRSALFREYFAARNDVVFREVVLPLREKLHGVADLAVERLGDAVADSLDPDFLLAAADKTLARLGYGPQRPAATLPGPVTNQQNNFFVVDRDDLAEARARMQARFATLAKNE